ncbi:hypothetical protein H0W91_00275 [Patescibacteria group bacterium]|nr:hypothetical protein [Patescibacteria group bacterium]
MKKEVRHLWSSPKGDCVRTGNWVREGELIEIQGVEVVTYNKEKHNAIPFCFPSHHTVFYFLQSECSNAWEEVNNNPMQSRR